MGLGVSAEQPAGGAEGFHLHGVQENSPAQQAGLEPYFDFIITIGHSRLNKENDTLKALLKANVEKPVKLEVFNMKTMRVREVEVVPSNMWGGQGLLGASVRFCSFRRASEQVWHVLDVEPSSPAALAGLRPYTDYVVGSDQILQESEDFFTLIESHEGKPLKLMVYNSKSDSCREPPSYHKKPPGTPPPSALPLGAPPPDALPPGPTPEDSPSLETGSRQSDYMEALLQAPGSSMEDPLPGPGSPSHSAPDPDGLPHFMETPLQPPPPVQRVMDPGFLDVSGISLLDNSNASVWPSLPSSTELTTTAVSTSGPEDICSSSSSHERGGEATWSGSEFEVSFLDSPGAQAQADHLPQLTLPDSLTSAASPEDGLSAELLEAQAEEEPASTEGLDTGTEAEGLDSQAQISTTE
ncbi:Golgi reassembly-stacking protein 1 isoform X5 [Pan paniscus]|uniref:Golgi reassembly stacking protein 1 n=1 Tax=Homo sapiens TaxID=9606 RepID=A0A8Q3SHU6_HUMAN|nr:Golgi reassembly-stacking protein 1 isoform 4 [Homo sapiens]XP_009443481.1 Golgi reassembly-stacking protein 1 isoform X2 [Pan troglodytes]XP_054965666.1 Golgi reassembly-stacking protein 1 isoform X5 [Pan paniscus]|eukprot:XP_016862539.1 Golgi reassembly-stacking protein 1 isoform X3 [Homo sapiens]